MRHWLHHGTAIAGNRPASKIDERGAGRLRRDLAEPRFLVALYAYRSRSSVLGSNRFIFAGRRSETQLETAIEIAPDENARAYELDLLGHQPSAEEGTSIHTYCRLGRAGNRLSVRINKFDVSQAKMGETGLAIALDDDAGEVDLHAP